MYTYIMADESLKKGDTTLLDLLWVTPLLFSKCKSRIKNSLVIHTPSIVSTFYKPNYFFWRQSCFVVNDDNSRKLIAPHYMLRKEIVNIHRLEVGNKREITKTNWFTEYDKRESIALQSIFSTGGSWYNRR